MASSEERAAIARALRGDPTETLIEQTRDGFEGMTYHEAAYRYWDLCRRVRSVAKVDIVNSTCSVLADLIDPGEDTTTFAVDKYTEDGEEMYPCTLWECDRCGNETIMLRGEGEPAACPYCGRRNADGDE